jgi:hypothetical protein
MIAPKTPIEGKYQIWASIPSDRSANAQIAAYIRARPTIAAPVMSGRLRLRGDAAEVGVTFESVCSVIAALPACLLQSRQAICWP